MELPEFAQFYSEICQFDKFLGLDLTVHDAGNISYQLTIQEQHLSMPGSCHGGVLAAMMDAVLGLTALSMSFPQGQLCQTVEFKINYLATPDIDDKILGRGKIEFSGSRLIVTSGEIIDLTSEKSLSKGMGTFSLYPLAKRAKQLKLAMAAAESQQE